MSQVFDLQSTPIEDGVTLIEASAGTGKTYCLTGLVLRLLLERRVNDVGDLLVVTFTQAATQELVDRIRSSLSDLCRLLAGEGETDDPFLRHLARRYRDSDESLAVARLALVRFDDLTVSTIHGFCKRVLEDRAFESGVPFAADLLENDAPMLRDAARDVWRRLLYPAPWIVAAVAAAEGWGPETFLADYELWRRHPHTEILPRPAHLDTAIARLQETHRALSEVWSLDAMLQLLARRRFRRQTYLGRGPLEERLREADAFCRDGLPAGIRTVKELAAARLAKSLFKRDLQGVPEHPIVVASSTLSAAIDGLRHALRCRCIAEIDALFARQKRGAFVLTYDDLLRRLRDALADPRRGKALAQAVRRQYRAALIDEFQDTDLIQYDIFRRLFRRGPLFLIGDPKQAIYRFRGADVFAYLAAKHDAERTYTLERNWRTAAPLVAAINAVFGRAPRPFVFERIAFEPAVAAETITAAEDQAGLAGDAHPPLQWLWLARCKTRQAARQAIDSAVTGEVVRLLAGGLSLDGRPLRPDDIAVLVRTNEEAQGIQSALRDAAVPSVVGRSGDIFLSEEMADLERLLAAIADPGYAPRLRAAWATRLWGDDAGAIRRLNRDDEAFARRLERFDTYREDWQRRGFMPMIQRLFADRRVRPRLLATAAGERRLTNLVQAVEVLHHAETERHLSPAALLAWLAAERARDRIETDLTELRLESDAPAVQIVTVHRSKGLEYEIVFCPYLWEARPITQPPVEAHVEAERRIIDCGSDALAVHVGQAEAERLAEDLRLTYVALTRARQRCYVVWGDIPGKDGPAASALGYLLRPGVRPQDDLSAVFDSAAAGDWTARTLAQVRAGQAQWRRHLDELTGRHPGLMATRSLAAMAAEPAASLATTAEQDLQPRPFRGRVSAPWTVESFSSLSRGGDGETPDHQDPATPEALRIVAAAEPLPPAEQPDTGLLAFARGRRAGTCLHQILERCDFSDVASEDTERHVAETLRRHGLHDPANHLRSPPDADAPTRSDFDPVATVHRLLRRLATAILPGTDFSLSRVPAQRYLVEWKFTTPLTPIAPRCLADLFRRHGRGAISGDYAEQLASLSAREVGGYLTGFVDLILRHEGRWYLIDWKSNDLGPDLAAYGAAGVWQAMCHHHYVLQYHLYVYALHRFLRQRWPDYDYRRHFGGAYYVFLRGLGGADGSARRGDADGRGDGSTGWYRDRPPRRLIAALDELIDGRAAA